MPSSSTHVSFRALSTSFTKCVSLTCSLHWHRWALNKKGHRPSRKTPPESKCLCMCGCMIIISQACLSAQRCAGTVCVCMWVTVQCAYLKINSRVCPLVIVASHVDKSEPHCVQRLVLKSIMESQRFLRLCVCLCGNAQTSNSPSARQASSRENCIMDDTVSTSMGHWTWGKAFNFTPLFTIYER